MKKEDFEKLASKSKSNISKFDYLRITDSTPIETPIPVITINDEIISTEGSITTISGESKSGKSAFTSILLAGAISCDGILDGLDGVKVFPNEKKKAVLHFDTEQARHKHKSNLKTILKRCDMTSCPDYFRSYNIRQLDIKDYQKTTKEICREAADEHDGIHLIVIDGIADYIYDVNEPAESNAIIKFFDELAIEYRTPIIVIVHTNPGSEKERGHLGSQCQRKSESIIMIKTEGDISFILPKFLKMAGKGNVPMIQFTYDRGKGYHTGCGIRVNDQVSKDVERIALIEKICKVVFGGQRAYEYQEALDAIMKHSLKAETTAKGYFKEMKAHQMILKGDDKNWRINSGNATNDEEQV